MVCAQAVLAQNPSSRPLRFMVGNPPGGGQDIIARMVGAKLSEVLAVPVVVDNRPGASGNMAAEMVARAPSDGQTLLMIGFANTTNVGLFKQLPFDLLQDFAPVTLVGESTNYLVVPATSRISTVGDLISEAKTNPGKLNYASGGNGTAPHLGSELFKRMAGIDIVHVPFKGGGQSMTALVTAQVDMLIVNPLAGLPQIKAGRIKAVAVTSLKRVAPTPAVPTVAEAGLAGYELISWWGIVAPARTARPVIQRLDALIAQALRHPDLRERFDAQGIDTAASTPEIFATFLRQEVSKWTKVIRDAGIAPI